MTSAHKQALAAGREESRAVRRYLVALDANRPRRGRQRTPESIRARLKQIEERLKSADALSRALLTQEKINLTKELSAKESKVDMAALEAGFISNAKAYGERRGLSYAAWRAAGVSPSVLAKAGITRSRMVNQSARAGKR
jgi:hypothetical protein